VKIKLDENLPAGLANDLKVLGHDADTAREEGLTGRPDKDLWDAAGAAERFLVTQDLDFSDLRAFGKRATAGVLVIRLAEPSRIRLTRRVTEIFRTENVESWIGCLVVATDRIRAGQERIASRYRANRTRHRRVTQVGEGPERIPRTPRDSLQAWDLRPEGAMTNLILVAPGVLVLAFVGWSQDTSRPVPTTRPAPKLRLELKTSTPTVVSGQSPDVTAELLNEGAEPIVVPLPSEGSLVKTHTPIVRWTPPMGRYGGCGSIMPRPTEVVTLQPRQRVNLGRWIGRPTLPGPGKHSVSLEIENVPSLHLSRSPPDPRVTSSQPFKVTSNVVVVERAPDIDPSLLKVTEEEIRARRKLDLDAIDRLKAAGADLSKPLLVRHQFICPDKTSAGRITDWASRHGYNVSRHVPGKWKGEDAISFDLVKSLVPDIESVTRATTPMLEIARLRGGHYEGWDRDVEK
jgi:predicted nuclease of predicted toxin-antitoxin system